MKPQTFQHPEIRDENDNIIKPGAFGKNTPFCTKGNDGILDYIANDLEYLYENRGSGGSGAGPSGPKGDPGPKGADGKNGVAATIKVGKVTTGPSASVTNSGNSTDAVFDFVIPVSGGGQGIQGPKGDPGPRGEPGPKGDPGQKGADGKDGTAATIKIGTVTTTAPGTNVKVTNSGTANAAVFNFSIPKGEKGEKGEKGNIGIQGPPGPAADLSQYVKKTEIFDGNMIKLPNGAKIGVE
ncbi:hypothetical protein [Dialister invisus]|jgi:hypothetical protein|uniref:hypothetical protein n=1 Tax=Dialister invisus TaxID=218538 RepID=UPI003FD82F1E